jgi:hypothetical protein
LSEAKSYVSEAKSYVSEAKSYVSEAKSYVSEAKRYGSRENHASKGTRVNDDFRRLKWNQVKPDETCSEKMSAAIQYVVDQQGDPLAVFQAPGAFR